MPSQSAADAHLEHQAEKYIQEMKAKLNQQMWGGAVNTQGNLFTHSDSPGSLVKRLVEQVRSEVILEITPKILNYIARNLQCDCTSHSGDCPWTGDLRAIRSRMEDALCAMQLEDKLTL